MSEIQPKYVDGEPVCVGKYCPSHKKLVMGIHFTAYQCEQYGHHGEVLEGDICIPGLRQQRDQAIAERDELKKQLSAQWTREPIPDENDYYFFAEWHKGEWLLNLWGGYGVTYKPNTKYWMRSQPIRFPEEPEEQGE